jgi:hypothetical protein
MGDNQAWKSDTPLVFSSDVLHDFSFLLLLCVNNNQRPSSTIHFHVECGSGVVVCCWPNRIKVLLLPSSIVPEISIIFFSFKQQNSDGDDMGVALANDRAPQPRLLRYRTRHHRPSPLYTAANLFNTRVE